MRDFGKKTYKQPILREALDSELADLSEILVTHNAVQVSSLRRHNLNLVKVNSRCRRYSCYNVYM